jgi:putative oxidoreductase
VDLALLLVRLVGIGFAAHGAQKLFGWFGGYGLDGTGGYFESIGFRPGKLHAALAGVSELTGGLLLTLGLFGPFAAMFIVAVMVVAIFSVHWKNGFFAQNGGYELPLLYIAVAVVVALVGSGTYSLDAALGLSALWTPALSWGAIGLGVLGAFANLATRRKPAPAQQASAG